MDTQADAGVARPSGLDPHQLLKVKPVTLDRYRASGRTFSIWLDQHQYRPVAPEEWDDLLVDFKNDCGLSRSQFEVIVATLEFAFPRLKGTSS